MRRTGALAVVLLLHAAVVLGALGAWVAPRTHATAAEAVTMRLIAEAAPAARPARAPQAPAPATPLAVLLLPPPAWVIETVPAAPAAVERTPPPPAGSPITAAATVPAAVARPAESQPLPPLQAAAPADRLCAAQNVARHYPPMLRERGIEGRVLLRVHVDDAGHPVEIQVQAGSGYRLLDEAARRLTQACQFLPARRGEQTLASWVEYPVRFALNQE